MVSAFQSLIEAALARSGIGPKGYDVLGMLKALFLQALYSLSDAELERALENRLDFIWFTKLILPPDSATICRFRGVLADKGVFQQILDAVMKQLSDKGIKVKCGSIVDATAIQSAARPKRESIAMPTDSDEDGNSIYSVVSEKLSADKDATWTKKGNQSHFGYKAYYIANEDCFLTSVHVQPANVSKVTQLGQILEKVESGSRLYADKGYASAENRKLLESRKVKDGIMHKAQRNTLLTKLQKRKNKLISKARYVIEQSFGTLKRRLKFVRSSYMGLTRTTAQCALKAMALNLIKASNMLHHA